MDKVELSDGDDIIVQANSMRVIQPTPWSKSVYIEHKDSIELQHSEGGVNTLQTLELTIQATNALTGTLSWNLPESLQLVSGLPTQSITIPQGETQHFRIVVRPLKAIQYELSCSLRDPSGRDIAPNYTQMVMYVTETKVTATR